MISLPRSARFPPAVQRHRFAGATLKIIVGASVSVNGCVSPMLALIELANFVVVTAFREPVYVTFKTPLRVDKP